MGEEEKRETDWEKIDNSKPDPLEAVQIKIAEMELKREEETDKLIKEYFGV